MNQWIYAVIGFVIGYVLRGVLQHIGERHGLSAPTMANSDK